MSDPSEAALIEGLKRGDPAAVETLQRRYGARVFQLANRHLKNHEDAQEVAQDVLLKVSSRIDAFRGDAALGSWIYRITFNAAMSRLRSMRSIRAQAVADSQAGEATRADGDARRREPADWSSLADEHVLRGELREELAEAVRDLPAIYRAPVILRDIRGLSTEEASAVLKVKGQTLKSRLHRGRLILRERLRDFAGGLSLHRPLPAQ
jgi:RNA polymerase sigma-70 factor, ECF subfamily